jgi:hypothetical protein
LFWFAARNVHEPEQKNSADEQGGRRVCAGQQKQNHYGDAIFAAMALVKGSEQ